MYITLLLVHTHDGLLVGGAGDVLVVNGLREGKGPPILLFDVLIYYNYTSTNSIIILITQLLGTELN